MVDNRGVCPDGRGSGLENRWTVKGSGVRFPHTSFMVSWRNGNAEAC